MVPTLINRILLMDISMTCCLNGGSVELEAQILVRQSATGSEPVTSHGMVRTYLKRRRKVGTLRAGDILINATREMKFDAGWW